MIPEDRMSTAVDQALWHTPDGDERTLMVDYEAGPSFLNITTEGLYYQKWTVTWDSGTGDFIATPATVGSPVVVHNAANVSQLSFCFDQNAHINIAYTSNGLPYLYWYDTNLATHVTTALPSYVFCPTLTLDDKRASQSSSSDMMLWWTQEQPDHTYNLYRAYQRDRFDPLVPKDMYPDVLRFIYKCGMNLKFRVQIELRNN